MSPCRNDLFKASHIALSIALLLTVECDVWHKAPEQPALFDYPCAILDTLASSRKILIHILPLQQTSLLQRVVCVLAYFKKPSL